MRRALPLAVLAALLLPLPPAGAQATHEHEASSGVLIAHDAAPDGRTYVGNLNHFAVLYMGDDDEPDFHQQNHVRVTLDGAVVFETTPDSGHDYDGVYGFDVVFGRPGHYRVEALQEGDVVAHFEGDVHPFAGNSTGTPGLAVTPASGAGGLPPLPPVEDYVFLYGARDANGSLYPHSDTVLELYRNQNYLGEGEFHGEEVVTHRALELRLKTHTHQEAQEVRAVLQGTDYAVRASTYLSYPEKGGAEFQPSSEVAYVLPLASSSLPTDAPALPAPAGDNVVIRGTAQEPLELLGTYDPYNVVGPGTLQHLNVVVLDPATGQTRQHVNFQARLTGPGGRVVLASDTLHEYDGILEVETVQSIPGVYTLEVDAQAGNWSGRIELPYSVAVGVGTIAAGPQLVTLDAPEAVQAGAPARFNFHVADPSSQAAFQHGEIDLVIDRVEHEGDWFGVPVLRAKLHTHESGDFAFDFAFPEAGHYTLRASPYPLSATPTPLFWGGEAGGGLLFTVEVAGGEPTSVPADEAGDGEAQEAPGLPLPVIMWILALVVLKRRST